MAPSMDCAVSSLLCAEDNSSIFCNEDDDVGFGFVEEVVGEDIWYPRIHRNGQENRKLFNGDEFYTGVPLQSDECLVLMIEKECEHMPAVDYLERLRNGDLDIGARDEILDWIAKVWFMNLIDGLYFKMIGFIEKCCRVRVRSFKIMHFWRIRYVWQQFWRIGAI